MHSTFLIGVDPWADCGTCPSFWSRWNALCCVFPMFGGINYNFCHHQTSDFKAKIHQFRFRLGLCPRPCSGSLQRSLGPLAGFKGTYLWGQKREEKGKWDWKGTKWRGLSPTSILSPTFLLRIYGPAFSRTVTANTEPRYQRSGSAPFRTSSTWRLYFYACPSLGVERTVRHQTIVDYCSFVILAMTCRSLKWFWKTMTGRVQRSDNKKHSVSYCRTRGSFRQKTRLRLTLKPPASLFRS